MELGGANAFAGQIELWSELRAGISRATSTSRLLHRQQRPFAPEHRPSTAFSHRLWQEAQSQIDPFCMFINSTATNRSL